MGKDKALLPFRGGPLAGHVASIVAAAAGSATLIGDPQKYGHLGYPVIPDHSPGTGPLGGIGTALRFTAAQWNLVLACDMPAISADFLRSLLDAAERLNPDALLPAGPSGRLEPLSAVYHRRCLPALQRALEAGVRKVADALLALQVAPWPVADAACFQNLNTPEEWACYHVAD
jgi:molybdopterin-guanine dinucleotide biosynthesis protein A